MAIEQELPKRGALIEAAVKEHKAATFGFGGIALVLGIIREFSKTSSSIKKRTIGGITRRRLVRLSCLLSVVLVFGCAHIDIKRLTDQNEKGARFYAPEPYVLQTQSDKGCAISIVYLPKISEPWVIQVEPGLGSVNGSATLTDGWNLTAFGQQLDSKIPETITALTGAAKLGVAPAEALAAPSPPCAPGLHKLQWNGTGWQLP